MRTGTRPRLSCRNDDLNNRFSQLEKKKRRKSANSQKRKEVKKYMETVESLFNTIESKTEFSRAIGDCIKERIVCQLWSQNLNFKTSCIIEKSTQIGLVLKIKNEEDFKEQVLKAPEKNERLYFSADLRNYYLKLCAKGFTDNASIHVLKDYREHIQEDVYHVLEQIQNKMNV